ncbi:MAG: response regulator, partial [Bacteroides sp.]|nr:response regulator [Bacteroides sp.]
WIGGENELASYIGNRLQVYSLKDIQEHPQTHINIIVKDSRGRVWTGLYKDGIVYYDTKERKFHRVGDEASKELDVRCIYEDRDGKIWIGAEQGLYSYSNRRWKEEKAIESQLNDKNIHGILRTKDGNLWIGTFSKGVNILDKDNQPVHAFTTANGFPSNAVNHMTADSKGRIWVATREGLTCFADTAHPESYTHFSIPEGLANTQVRAIQEDRKGNIWISTNGGISRLDEQERKFYNYNHHDGIPMGDFMDGSACITPKGIIHFGSQNGVCHFNPDELSGIREVSPEAITRFVVYNQNTEEKESSLSLPISDRLIELSHGQNTFDISFNVKDYSQSTQVEFAYKLEGLSNEWFNTLSENQVTFRNIPHGNYTFKVKARFRNQVWNEQIDHLHIRIAPPFWLTWYAKLFYFLIIGVIVYMLLSFYKRRLVLESTLKLQKEKEKNIQELNNERLRFFTNITHELRTPLTLILGPLEDLLGDGTLSPKHHKKISIIHNSSLRLLDLINRILEFRKTQTQNRKLAVSRGNIAHLIQEIGLKYKELNLNKSVNYRTEIETEETDMFFDGEVVNMIVDNLMTNAGKYTSEGEICLRLRSVEENQLKYTEISVSDTGHGIAPEALPHIFDRYYQANSEYQASGSGIGLALVKSLADLHEAVLSVESELETGTTFRLRLLTNNTYPNAVHPEKKDEKPQPAIETPETEAATDEQPIILIVEDNADIREYVQSALGEVFEIITASNGKEGLETAQVRIPNVIVSDIMMPVMDGLELCRQLKKDIRTCHIPVVLLTAKDSMQDKETGYAAGADSYLTKPFSANLLHSRINNILETRKLMASLIANNTVPQIQEPAKETQPENKVQPLNRLDNEFLQKVTAIIEENLEKEKLDVSFIAEKMYMSHSTLYRKIKGLTEMSVNEFIRKIKMRKSLELMKDGYGISEIAYILGYSTTSYFRQCFKEEYGMSPSDYLKEKQ